MSSSCRGVTLVGSDGVDGIGKPESTLPPAPQDVAEDTRPEQADLGGARAVALPESMVAVLEAGGRAGLEPLLDSLLHQLDQALPERRWGDPDWVDGWGASGELVADQAYERFWDTDEEAEASRATKELITIAVLIPLVALLSLGVLVLTLGG